MSKKSAPLTPSESMEWADISVLVSKVYDMEAPGEPNEEVHSPESYYVLHCNTRAWLRVEDRTSARSYNGPL